MEQDKNPFENFELFPKLARVWEVARRIARLGAVTELCLSNHLGQPNTGAEVMLDEGAMAHGFLYDGEDAA